MIQEIEIRVFLFQILISVDHYFCHRKRAMGLCLCFVSQFFFPPILKSMYQNVHHPFPRKINEYHLDRQNWPFWSGWFRRIGTGQGIFTPMSLSDQILSAEFVSKNDEHICCFPISCQTGPSKGLKIRVCP